MEAPLRKMVEVHKSVQDMSRASLAAGNMDGDMYLPDLLAGQDDLQTSLLNTLQKVREVNVKFSSLKGFRKIAECYPAILQGFEKFILDSAEGRQSLRFRLGIYWSHLAVGAVSNSLFGRHPLASAPHAPDTWDLHVPAAMVKAESLLLSIADAYPAEYGVEVAHRLREHGQVFLAVVDDVPRTTEFRYRRAATYAANADRPRLASQLLARLGYFMSLRGRETAGLEVINEAVTHHDEPLAVHLQAQLRLNLGELTTNEAVDEALKQLKSAEGKLPTLGNLENHRQSLHSHLSFWRDIATSHGGVQGCFSQITDVAWLAICVACRVMFG